MNRPHRARSPRRTEVIDSVKAKKALECVSEIAELHYRAEKTRKYNTAIWEIHEILRRYGIATRTDV